MGKAVALIAGKGGVGKATTAINLSYALKSFGRNSILVDANPSTTNVTNQLGMALMDKTLHAAIQGDCSIHDAIKRHKTGLQVVPGSVGFDEALGVRHTHLGDSIAKLKEKTEEVIFLDTPPGVSKQTEHTIKEADMVLLVTTPSMSGMTNSLKTLQLAKKHKKPIIGAIVTKFKGDQYDKKPQNISEFLEIPILGVVPFDDSVRKSHFFATPLTHIEPNSPASVEYKKIACQLIGTPYESSLPSQEPKALTYQVLKGLGMVKHDG